MPSNAASLIEFLPTTITCWGGAYQFCSFYSPAGWHVAEQYGKSRRFYGPFDTSESAFGCACDLRQSKNMIYKSDEDKIEAKYSHLRIK